MQKTITIHTADQSQRLDLVLVKHFPNLSRSQISKAIQGRQITINKRSVKASHKLKTGDRVVIRINTSPHELRPSQLSLDIIYEDSDILLINKPPYLTVHPGAGHTNDTLVSALLAHCGKHLACLDSQRPGIVHRLDKNTSGIMVIAKTDLAHQSLSQQFHDHTIHKIYLALVTGTPQSSSGLISAPIARHPINRQKMSITTSQQAKTAETKFQITKQFPKYSLLEIDLLTGRTHQIRVHLQAIHHPVLGDPTYGNPKINKIFRQQYQLRRQFLHAHSLSFIHPSTNKLVKFQAPLATDLQEVLEKM